MNDKKDDRKDDIIRTITGGPGITSGGPNSLNDLPTNDRLIAESDSSSEYITTEEPQSSASGENSEIDDASFSDDVKENGSSDEGSMTRIKPTDQLISGFAQETPSGKEDKSGFWHIASAIHMMIENNNVTLPYNIGLVGVHGIGKTTVLEQVKTHIDKKAAKSKVAGIVEFDVGRHHDEKIIWASLIAEFFKSFSRKYKFWGRFKYYFARDYNLKGIATVAINIGVLILAVLLTIALLFWEFKSFEDKLKTIWGIVGIIISNSAIILSVAFSFIYSIKVWGHPLVIKSLKSFNSYPEAQELIKDRCEMEQRLSRLVRAWIRKGSSDRILLIIDNLDRCSYQHVSSIIDELFALMSTPDVKEHLFTLVAVDENYVISSLEKQRRVVEPAYFEKLFSLKVNIPFIDAWTLSFYLEDTIGLSASRSVSKKLEEYDTCNDVDFSDKEKKEFFAKLQYVVNLTPRRINRAIFAFRFIKYIWARIDGDFEHFHSEDIIDGLAAQLSGQGIPKGLSEKYKRYLEIVPVYNAIDQSNPTE